jgi:predicted Ser/Thr protein kinase
MNEAQPNPNMEQKCPQCGAPLPSGVLAGLCPACLFKQGAAADTALPPETPPFLPPGVEEVARLFPQLEIIALIGKGGMGAVYQARQPALDRIVALKILPPQTAGGPGFVERFNREARALARLNHPNIVAVYEFGQVNGLPFFIMEFVDGLNLRELERAGKLSAREALQIVPQICDALQFAHDEGIVHRDIKPENILLDKKGRVKIADFGIAKILGGTPEVDLTQTKGAIGTPHYMAPEQMEKPTTVDHRADIFSLGVVFYEMLTGELPLGKFAPPSSRKVEVDVRLDDVVLRALEKDPERRYQHASQVKTAVDTIAAGAAPPPTANGAALAQEILARDYTLNIRSCIRRGWNLLKGEFWPFVGITALILALLGFASSFGGNVIRQRSGDQNTMEVTSGVAMLVWGPLMGGLLFYFLKKIRREPATVETAFCGFSPRFLQLFLAGFVTCLLTWLGFACLILPGIYLLIAWMFVLPLVVDKQLDFWSAMELSRKVVTKHWFKFLGFGIVLWLLAVAGVLALIIGVFVASPLILAAMMYAYEDIFGGTAPTVTAPVGTGPTGTVVVPVAKATPPQAAGGTWTLATKIGLALVILVIGAVAIMSFQRQHGGFIRAPQQTVKFEDQVEQKQMERVTPLPEPFKHIEQVVPPDAVPPAVFGPVMERELTNFVAINLASGQAASLPEAVTGQNRGPEKDSAACAWLERANMDFAYVSEYDGFYGMTRAMATLKQEDWDNTSPDSLAGLLHDTGQDVGTRFGESSRLDNPTNNTYGFKTRDGGVGLLQVTGFNENPPVARIRYKLFQPATNQESVASGGTTKEVREQLSERLEAASSITDSNEKDEPLAAVAADAAKAGEAGIASSALTMMRDQTARDAARHEAATLLAERGLRKQAIQIAKAITDSTTRNQTLSELAQ